MSAFQDYLDRVAEYRAQYPEQREGQAHANVLSIGYADLPDPTLGGPEDPFYVDANLPAFLEFVRTHLDGAPQ